MAEETDSIVRGGFISPTQGESARWVMAGFALALVLLIPHGPLLAGRASPIWDALELFAPYYMLVGDFARQGQFLLWNPFTLAGAPDYVEPQLGSFSPLVVLFGIASGGSRHGFHLYWLTIWWIAGAGVLCFARHLRAPVWGGFVAALGFTFSGFYTGNAEHTALLNTVSFLPLVLWRADVALRTHLHRPAVEAGALFGMSALAGYPGLVLLNGAFVAMWSLGRVCWPDHGEPRNIRKNLGHAVVTVALVAIIGFIVMTPTYVPFFVEAPGYSQRTDALSRELAVENDALHHAALLTIANPALALADIYEYTDISMRSVYLGSLLPCLAAFALLKRPDGGLRWWLLFMALFFLASAMGRTLPVRGWLYDWFPPTRYFRHSALFRCYFLFALTVLGVLGAGTWR